MIKKINLFNNYFFLKFFQYINLFFGLFNTSKNSAKSLAKSSSIIFLELTKKMHLFSSKYPKIIAFIICIIITIFLSQNPLFINGLKHLEEMSYLGVLISGALFSFGFTTPLATLALLNITPENIFLAAIIGGAGATVSDVLIFKFVKFSFENEFKELKKERPFLFVKETFTKNIHPNIINYLAFVLGGILLSSPLPDEAGIMIIAGISEIKTKILIMISFFFKTIGIFILLAL